MLERISKKITDSMIAKKLIPPEEKEIYIFGMKQLFFNIINVITLLAIGILMGMPGEAVIFISGFSMIRKYAGGFHADTPLMCYFITCAVAFAVLYILDGIDLELCLLPYAVASGIVLTLAPMESANKPLDKIEKLIYREKSVCVWTAELILAFILILLGQSGLSKCIMMATIVSAISLLLAYLKTELS